MTETTATATEYDLRKRAILVRVTTKMLGTQKKDKEATATAAKAHEANEGQVFVGKDILNKKNPAFRKIKKIRDHARQFHLSTTGPWQDDGFRIIGTKTYSTWREALEDLSTQFDDAVSELVVAYADLKAEARQNLGDLYDETLYPAAEDLQDAFDITIETEVLPDRSNIALDLDKARTEKIIQDAKAADDVRVKTLTADTHRIVREALEKMIESLVHYGEDNPGKKRAKHFKNTLVDNMTRLAETLPGLNITGDARLDKLAQDIAEKLTIADASDLRGDKRKGDNRTPEQREKEAAATREEVSTDAKELLDNLTDVFGGNA